MNILHITTFLQGGAGKIIVDLAISQKKSGHKVYVITTLSEEKDYCNYPNYIAELRHNDIECIKIDSSFKRDLYLNFNAVHKVTECIREFNIEIIHCHAAIPCMIGLLARQVFLEHIPILTTMHGWGLNKTVEQSRMDVHLLNCCDAVVSVSNSDGKLLISKNVDKNKLKTIYNGIEKTYSDISLSIDIQKYLKQLKNNKLLIGCIGTVCDRKNQELLIKALNEIQDDNDYHLMFFGEGEGINRLEKFVVENNLQDKIIFFGGVERAFQYIKYFDFMCLPSKSEGFGLVIIEAFREMVPVIVSDIDVFKEIVEDGINGFMFKSNDRESLKNLLRKVKRMNKEYITTITDRAYKSFINNFTKDKMIEGYNNLYAQLLSKVTK